ncbi:MAG: GNAT family N-acetyltransferase [Planctomycetes bacterium]|nr:GNAT family N-acetyltransferase [Planctomycetota bacterium]
MRHGANRETVSLRIPCAADAKALVAAVQASCDQLSVWLPWATADYGDDTAIQWIDGAFGASHRFVIETGGQLLGCGFLSRFDRLHRSAHLGYWVRTDRTRQGYATAATRLMTRFALGPGAFERVEIRVAVGNLASRRVAEKSGATFEGIARNGFCLHGVMHDVCVFSFVRGDAIPNAPRSFLSVREGS